MATRHSNSLRRLEAAWAAMAFTDPALAWQRPVAERGAALRSLAAGKSAASGDLNSNNNVTASFESRWFLRVVEAAEPEHDDTAGRAVEH